MAWDGRISFAHTAEHEKLKTVETWERLQFDQPWCQSIAFATNSEIDHEKIWVPSFIWNFQPGWNGIVAVAREFRRARFRDDLVRRAHDFVTKVMR